MKANELKIKRAVLRFVKETGYIADSVTRKILADELGRVIDEVVEVKS